MKRSFFGTLLFAIILASIPLLASHSGGLQRTKQQQHEAIALDEYTPRRLELEVVHSDDLAESVMTLEAPRTTYGIGEVDHARIVLMLNKTMEIVRKSRVLAKTTMNQEEGRRLMDIAEKMFKEVKEHIRKINDDLRRHAEQRGLLRRSIDKNNKGESEKREEEDHDRAMDISHRVMEIETMVSFPQCVQHYINHCIAMINRELRRLGLSTVDMVVHEKRSELPDQEGYNKVVIITNELADRVVGRDGDGKVTYPYLWNDKVFGNIMLGDDGNGEWDCRDKSPNQCCTQVTDSVPNPDKRNNTIACHIFVPLGGIRERRDDRVIINLSGDGRVHETPVLG